MVIVDNILQNTDDLLSANPLPASGEALARLAVGHAVHYPNTPIKPETLFLLEKVANIQNLKLAFKQVKANNGAPGIDSISVKQVALDQDNILADLSNKLLEGKFYPLPVRRVAIPKPNGGTRNLGIPTVIDRIGQQAILQVLNPIIDPTFSDSSHGFRKGRSINTAIKAAELHIGDGFNVTVAIDLTKCFDTIDHNLLFNCLRKHISDKRVLLIIGKFLRAGILDQGVLSPSSEGTPQGGPLSPLLSNIFLDQIDKFLETRGFRFVRYADDLTVFVKSTRAANRIFDNLSSFLENILKLQVNKAKSVISSNYTNILGFLIRCDNSIFIPSKKIVNFKLKIRSLTRRQCGRSIAQTIKLLNPVIRGWFHHIKIAEAARILRELDSWIKRRIRAIFLKQCKRKKTRHKRLIAFGIHPFLVNSVAFSSKGLWRLAKTNALHAALNNRFFAGRKLFSLSKNYQIYVKSQT